MNTLDREDVKTTLARLHRRAGRDWMTFAAALPRVIVGAVQGRSVMESAKPALKNAFIPIDASQGRALYQLARASGAQRIVEFGCSFGISTLYLAAAVHDNGGGEVITTELEPNKIDAARANFKAAGLDAIIDLRAGDALETLKDAPWPVDMVFLDGWKELCLPVLRTLEPKLRPNAVILCDDMKGFRRTLKPYVDYVRAPDGNYISMGLPLGDELEFSVFRPPNWQRAA
jgi:predicted O-methyltransferase YrrM